MDSEDALTDMHRLLGPREAAPPAVDQDLLDRLLEGRLDPASAPPGYGGLARLLAAATAPAAPDELAGEQLTMATFAAAMRSHPPTLVPRRTAVPRKVFTMKAAAVALVAVLSLGGVAAAAGGLLPDQASPVADQAAAGTGADAAAHGLGKAAAANLGGSAGRHRGGGPGWAVPGLAGGPGWRPWTSDGRGGVPGVGGDRRRSRQHRRLLRGRDRW
jgi:hypothetical protein